MAEDRQLSLTLTYVYVCINVLQLQASFLLYTLLSRYHLLKLTTVHIRICIKTRQYLTSCSNPCLLHTILYVQDLLNLSMYYYCVFCVYWYMYTHIAIFLKEIESHKCSLPSIYFWRGAYMYLLTYICIKSFSSQHYTIIMRIHSGREGKK